MEFRSLVDVDLRDVLRPINQGAQGEFLPALRTASLLRERVKAGVLDLTLSQAAFVREVLVGAVLVEHLPGGSEALLDVFAVDALSQKGGGLAKLIEATVHVARAQRITTLRCVVSALDTLRLSALHASGFVERQPVARYQLLGAHTDLPKLIVCEPSSAPPSEAAHWAQPVEAAALAPLWNSLPAEAHLFGDQLEILSRLSARLHCIGVVSASHPSQLVAGAAIERERKLLIGLAGDNALLSALLCTVSAHHAVQYLDAIALCHPAIAALQAAGFQKTAARLELTLGL